MSTPMSPEQRARAHEIAERAAGDRFFVEDCEGSLSVWREAALVRVSRNEQGEQESGSPTPLRWGQGDAEMGDDDSVTLWLSGPSGEPYVLELEPERAAALRAVLAERSGGDCCCEPERDHDDLTMPAAYLHQVGCPVADREEQGRDVDEYLYCGADLGHDEFPTSCYRRVGHDGECGPAADRKQKADVARPYDAECRDGYPLGQECPSCHAMEGTPHAPDMVACLPRWSVRTVQLCRMCSKHAGHPAHRKAGRCG